MKSLILSLFLALPFCLYAQDNVQTDDKPDIPGAIAAAEQGNVDAQCFLGIIYSTGQYDVEQNYAEAIKWFTMAAEKGEPTAQYNLSLFYIEGFGVTPDTVTAQKWYDLAAKQLDDLPPLIVERPATNDILSSLPSGKKKNGKDKEKLSAKDKVKYEEAIKKYRSRAEAGDAIAQYNLGVLYSAGLGTPVNHKEAMKWYRMAADQGDADAQNNIGIMYYQGQGVGKNYSQAFHWYNLAAEQGHVAAQYNIGIMYEQGIGTEKNRAKAKYWLKLAADQGYEAAKKRMQNL